jgi:hypothetical protein
VRHREFATSHFCGDIGQFTSLSGFDLLSHRLEVALHSVNTNRDAVDQRERLRVFGEHRLKHASESLNLHTDRCLDCFSAVLKARKFLLSQSPIATQRSFGPSCSRKTSLIGERDSRTTAQFLGFACGPVRHFRAVFRVGKRSLVTVVGTLHRSWCTLQIRNSSINLAVSISSGQLPGWRNWQTQRTQNPPVLSTLGVQLPLPAPAL